MEPWKCSDTKDSDKYLGNIEIHEGGDDYAIFDIIQTTTRLVFGGICNTGFLESGYIEIDDCFSVEENLQSLVEDLETFYRDGRGFVQGIVCNDRM